MKYHKSAYPIILIFIALSIAYIYCQGYAEYRNITTVQGQIRLG
jgi:hypothetical protein